MSEKDVKTSKNFSRELPHNLEAEQCVLCCIVIDGDLALEILPQLVVEDFFAPSHKTLFEAIANINYSHKTIDFVTVADELSRTGKMASIGGISYLTSLHDMLPSTANYRDYVEIVKRDATKRQLIRECSSIIEEAHAADERDKMLAAAEKKIYDINIKNSSKSLQAIKDNVGEVFTKLEIINKDPSQLKGIMSGFKKLDLMTNGFQGGNLVVIAGRPGQGKSSLAMNIVEHAAVTDGKVCAVFSLEMTTSEITQRMLFSLAGVSMSSGLSGKLRPEDWDNLMKANSAIANSKIFVDDSQITPEELLSRCRRLKSNEGLDLVMIDYIQLMTETKKKVESRQQEIASFTRSLKQIAKELNVPIIALSQLNREVEQGSGNKKPQLSNLRESGAIEQDADMVLFIHKPTSEGSSNGIEDINLIIAKHRNGPTGEVQLSWVKESVRFVDPGTRILGSDTMSAQNNAPAFEFELDGLDIPPDDSFAN